MTNATPPEIETKDEKWETRRVAEIPPRKTGDEMQKTFKAEGMSFTIETINSQKTEKTEKTENLSVITKALEDAHAIIRKETGAPRATILVTRKTGRTSVL